MSMALAQSGNLPDAPRPRGSTQGQSTATSKPSAQQSVQQDTGDAVVTQARPFPPFPRGPMGFPRGSMGPHRGPMSRGPMVARRGRYYRSPYRPAFSPQPSLPEFSPVGALIGLGMGAAIGAAGTANHTAQDRVTAAVIGGGLFALFGGIIGGNHGHSYREWERAHHNDHNLTTLRPSEPAVEASSVPAQAPSADFSSDTDSSTSQATTTEATGNTE